MGSDDGCECVPMVLMQMVMTQQEVMGRSLERAGGDTFEDESVKVGKKTCTCSFTFVVNGKKVKGTGSCDKKCSGAVKSMSLNSADYSYTFGFSVKKGKVKMGKVTAVGGSTGGTGGGSGMPGGGYSHSGCVCVHMPSDMGTGGGPGMPPMPPTGTGSGSGFPGSGTGPSGSGSGMPPTGGNGTGTTGGSNTGSKGYTQAWLRGPGDFVAHVHEGLELADASGFIAVGETSDESNFGAILVTRVDTEGNKVWSQKIGTQLSAAHTVVESGSNVIVGGGLYKTSTGKMQATLIALDSATGSTVWTTSLDHSGHGAIRGVILDGDSLVTTGYQGNNEGGFLFIADGDNARAMAWKFDLSGNLLTTTALGVDGMQQGAKIRADPVIGGYVIAGSVWMDDQQGIVVKMNNDLSVAWSWDYLAIKVDGATKQELWRRTYGQPRGFDARYIHDEMWGVSMDPEGNYLLLGGSGDEYSYSAESNGQVSDIWVSYLVVVSKNGDKLFEGTYGNQGGNEAGEYLTVTSTGDVMIYTDSDTTPGFGFLKITKNA